MMMMMMMLMMMMMMMMMMIMMMWLTQLLLLELRHWRLTSIRLMYICFSCNIINTNKRPLTPKSMPPTGDKHRPVLTEASYY